MTHRRGRQADAPTDIPAKGWKDIAVRVKDETAEDHTSLAAAGVAFFGFIAMIPGLSALVSIYALVADPAQVRRQLSELLGTLPEDARQLITDQLSTLAEQSGGALAWGTAISIALALWTASSGMANLVEALNITYDERDDRGLVAKRGLALLLSLGAIVLVITAGFVMTAVRPWLAEVSGSAAVGWAGLIAAWAIVGALFVTALAVLYRTAPDRDDPEWEWVSVGAVVAVVAWLLATILFQVYVANFGSYNETYGSLAAVIILMLWLYISAFVVLLGAQINASMELQTQHDTTVGPDEPLGRRGAVAADTLPEDQREPEHRA